MPQQRYPYQFMDFKETELRVVAWLDEAGALSVEQWDRLRGVRIGMFTKQHYLAVADILRKKRETLDPHSPHAIARRELLNDLTMDFARLFKNDSPKFRDLVFIGEACAGDIADTGKE